MKTSKNILFLLILSCFISLFTGCFYQKEINHFKEWDGQFLYLYHPDSDNCWVIGTAPTVDEPSTVGETLCIPSHYKGKLINSYKSHSQKNLGSPIIYHGIDITPVKKLYVPYSGLQGGLLGEYNHKTEYHPHLCGRAWEARSSDPHLDVYVPVVGYQNEFDNASKGYTIIEINNNYSFSVYNYDKEHLVTIYKANTAYMFNYEGAPNENYYFINNFERGGLIENTPYEPYREGYTFLGWYKDSDCTEIWDFETDTLPVATYDENGELEFVETRLYAKWSKT